MPTDKYYISKPLGGPWDDKDVEFTEVKGYPVTVEGWEEYDFFIHKTEDGNWVPSDGKTGACLKDGYFKTRKAAEEALREQRAIKERNYKSYEEIVAWFKGKYGLTPRYQEESNGN